MTIVAPGASYLAKYNIWCHKNTNLDNSCTRRLLRAGLLWQLRRRHSLQLRRQQEERPESTSGILS